ncbi:MAG: hypothetical protein Q7S57_04785 [bacterium]|nr:hypothetical protein [bacterium]
MRKTIKTLFLPIMFLLLVLFSCSQAFAQTGVAVTTIIGSPILTIDAGVLPTSPFYFLDNFDEWVQKNVFTFGIGSFRAEVFLESAAERVAELQFLNSQGTITNEIAQKLLNSWQNDLVFAAEIVGRDYMRGGRPIKLTDGILRTMLASADAIQAEFNENVVSGTESLSLGDNFLEGAEEKIVASLIPEDAPVPDAVLKMVVDDLAVEVSQTQIKIDSYLAEESLVGVILFGQKLLVDSIEENQKIARSFYEKGNYRNAMDAYGDCRRAQRLISNSNIIIEFSSITEKKELVGKLDQAMKLMTDLGLIDAGELTSEYDRILVSYFE